LAAFFPAFFAGFLAPFLAAFLAAGRFFTAAFALRAAFFFRSPSCRGASGAAIFAATVAPDILLHEARLLRASFRPTRRAPATLCRMTAGGAGGGTRRAPRRTVFTRPPRRFPCFSSPCWFPC